MQENNQTEKKNNNILWTILPILACIILGVIIYRMLSQSISVCSDAAGPSFESSYAQTKEDVYNNFYNMAYQSAEQENHVSNRVEITIEQIKEISKLEVYEAYDTEYVIHKYEEYQYESWYEFNGTCTYSIDLEKSEFIIDQQRSAVTVRIPEPEQEYDIDTPKRLLFADDTVKIGSVSLNDGSTLTGINDANNSEVEGREKIEDYFINNDKLTNNAKDAAKKLLTSLIKKVNSDVDDLNIRIEFFE